MVCVTEAVTFDDVLLVPNRSDIESRKNIDTSSRIGNIHVTMPIIAANMATICEWKMASTMHAHGGLGIIHRFNSVDQQARQVTMCTCGISVGIDYDWIDRIHSCDTVKLVCIDVAHAHSNRTLKVLKEILQNFPKINVIVGNIATKEAYKFLIKSIEESDFSRIAVKVGIGGGSLCTTRIQTGCGYPTLQSVLDIAQERRYTDTHEVGIIADGGIRSSGDIVKCLAAGANAVMLGSMLAGTDETPGNVIKHNGKLYKIYRGSASYASKEQANSEIEHIEGAETLVPYKGKVSKVLYSIMDGVRSGMSYCGASDLAQLRENAKFVKVSTNGTRESHPHLIE